MVIVVSANVERLNINQSLKFQNISLFTLIENKM